MLIVVFTTSLLFAQSRNVKVERTQIPDEEFRSGILDEEFQANYPTSGSGDAMVVTGYDYETNVATRRMLDLVDIDGDGVRDPIMAAMKRDVEGGDRFIMFAYKAFGVVDIFNTFDPSQTPFGWPEVQYCVGGPNDGQALVMGHIGGEAWHSWIDLVNLEPILPFPQTTFGDNATFAWPSFVYLGSVAGAIIGISNDIVMHLSVDGGATFDSLLSIGDGDSNVDMLAVSDFPAENPLRKSNDDMVIATLGCFAGAGTMGNPDVTYWYGSTDGGTTFSGNIIAEGSSDNPEWGWVGNRLTYAPWPNNFDQVGYNIDATGVTHVMLNGYGEGLYMGGMDTVNIYPMLYWNSSNGEWLAVTDENMEGPTDASGNLVDENSPGNGIGNAYGTVANSSDGQVVFVLWQGPEWQGDPGSSDFNLFPGDGGANTGPSYYTNIYYRTSEDGGATWGPVGTLQGDPMVQESYPVLAADLEINGDQATAHYLYYVDPIPGTSLFAGGNSFDPNGVWYYNSYTWTLTTGVEDEIVVNSFNLEQNYPNPFNPTTNIKYSLAERSAVSLIVYDILGNEIATLVNTTQSVGDYDINFDAANLASGLYIYTLKAGSFTSTKKMMLLK